MGSHRAALLHDGSWGRPPAGRQVTETVGLQIHWWDPGTAKVVSEEALACLWLLNYQKIVTLSRVQILSLSLFT